ncbi:MAG TPA: hypothetical protein VMQ86_21980 [Bryobacteraceae bacterium]|jgi:tetratricopeptide (TPR) repeat protein|nr:hypothetical protein [Bryobacteraceae bacterium]
MTVDQDPSQTIGQPAPDRLIAGRFRVVRPLGSGGMGEVFGAFDTQLGQSVALKLIRPQIAASPAAAARFKREVQLGREVAHPNLCRIFDLGSHVGGVRATDGDLPGIHIAAARHAAPSAAGLRPGSLQPGNPATRRWRRAEAALRLEDFDEARSELLRVPSGGLQAYIPAKADRIQLLAVRALAPQAFGNAQIEYGHLVAAVPREQKPEALVSFAESGVQNDQPAAALDASKQAQSIDPDYAPAIMLAADLHARRRENALAVPGFERAVTLKRIASNLPGQIQALLEYAQMLSARASAGDLDRVRRNFYPFIQHNRACQV